MNNNTLEIFTDRQSAIVQQWVEAQASEAREQIHGEIMSQIELRGFCEELYGLLLRDLALNADAAKNLDGITPLTEEILSLTLVWMNRGYTPRDIAGVLFQLKTVLQNVLAQMISDQHELFDESRKLDKVIDELVILAFECLIRNREKTILNQYNDINDISTPVIKIWDGVLGLPIIGVVDSQRIENMLSDLLTQIAHTQFYMVIIDISGVPTIDSMVANNLVKTVKAVNLMGGNCIISGMRPAIAQGMVNEGIDLSAVSTKATLADALRKSLSMMGYKIVANK